METRLYGIKSAKDGKNDGSLSSERDSFALILQIQSVLDRFVLGIKSVTTLDSRQRYAGTTLIKGFVVLPRRLLECIYWHDD